MTDENVQVIDGCEPLWDERLMCYVHRVEYDFRTKRGTLFLPDNSCTDMGGCIELFSEIDHRVIEIVTYSGVKLDTGYYREGGKWRAIKGRE